MCVEKPQDPHGGCPGKSARVLCVGEALVDVVKHADGSEQRHAGGSVFNVALGLRRLGADITLASWFNAHDRDGRLLARAGLPLAEGTGDAARTSTAVATLDGRGDATYEFDIDWSPGEVDVGGFGHLHVGSYSAVLEPGADAVLRAVRAAAGAATVSYDLNARPGVLGDPDAARSRMGELIGLSTLVKASDEDLAWFCGEAADPDGVAREWLERGVEIVALTFGARGCRVYAGERAISLEAPRVRVVDTIGAGDAFMAGFLAGLLETGGLDGCTWPAIVAAAERGTRNAAATVAVAGAHLSPGD